MIDQSEFYNQFCTQTVGTDWCVLEKFFPEVEGAFFPEKEDVFKAFKLVACKKVKYVILGLDPYPNGRKGEPTKPVATGVAFAVRPEDIKTGQIKSSAAIYKVLAGIYGNSKAKHARLERYEKSDLEVWVEKHKILLINSALTVPRNGPPKDHLETWRAFIGEVLKKVPAEATWIAWGKDAFEVFEEIDPGRCQCHYSHPSTSGNFAEFWETVIGKELSDRKE